MHGVYYLLLHVWFDLVGYSPFLLRLPSALAIGATVALLVALIGRLADRRTSVCTGVIAALLPALTWAGGEGRSYALTALVATASSAALALALEARGGRVRRTGAWVAYAAVTAFGGALFVFLLLLLPAHLLTVLIARRRSDHVVLRPFLIAAASVALAVSPLLVAASVQRAQVGWIEPLSAGTLVGVLVNQWFTAAPPYAVVAWAVLVVAAVVAVRRPAFVRAPITALSLALPWAVVPAVLLLAASSPDHSYYLPRYLTFAAPAVAVALGSALARDGRRGVALLTLLSLLALGPLVGSRAPEAKQRSTWAAAARVLDEQRGESGGAIVYGRLDSHATATTSLVALAYPDPFHGLEDVTAREPLRTTPSLWEPRRSLPEVLPLLQAEDVAWLLTEDAVGDRAAAVVQIGSTGLRLDGSWVVGPLRLDRFDRSPARSDR